MFFVAGVSYFKAYLPPEIVVEAGEIDTQLAEFLNKTYQRGLGEFFYVNQLDPMTKISFPVNTESTQPLSFEVNGLLIGIGGGKDSLVSVEALRDTVGDLSTWSLGHKKQLSPLVERVGLSHYWVERNWDKSLLDHNTGGALNGHVPISAILACAGVVTAILSGKHDVVVSNEASANEPTLQYKGVWVNHQYSKSEEFEKDFQSLLNHYFTNSIRYYSLLRPLSELKICELFAKSYFDKYNDVFSSCNRAFTHDSPGLFWDGKCSKCAFVFLALTPFVPRENLEKLFGGKNLLLDPELETTYKNLLGIEGDKPLECVGEIKESRSAMDLAKKQYQELQKYQYQIPSDYNYRAVAHHAIPPDIWRYVQAKIT